MQFLIAEVLPDAENYKGAMRGSCQLGTRSQGFQNVRLSLHTQDGQAMFI